MASRLIQFLKARRGTTAQPLREAVGRTPHLREGLKEIAYGQWEGRTPAEVNRQFHKEAYG